MKNYISGVLLFLIDISLWVIALLHIANDGGCDGRCDLCPFPPCDKHDREKHIKSK